MFHNLTETGDASEVWSSGKLQKVSSSIKSHFLKNVHQYCRLGVCLVLFKDNRGVNLYYCQNSFSCCEWLTNITNTECLISMTCHQFLTLQQYAHHLIQFIVVIRCWQWHKYFGGKTKGWYIGSTNKNAFILTIFIMRWLAYIVFVSLFCLVAFRVSNV